MKKVLMGVGQVPKYRKVSQGKGVGITRTELGNSGGLSTPDSLTRLGDHYAMYGRWGKALLYYTRALRSYDRNMGQPQCSRVGCLVKIGEVYFTLGLHKQAELVTLEALGEVADVVEVDRIVRMRALSLLGDIYSAERKYLMAECMYNTAIGYSRRRKQLIGAAIPLVFIKLAGVLAKQSRFSESIAIMNGGIEMLREQGDGFEVEVATALSEQGVLFDYLSHPEIAELLRKEAREYSLNASKRRKGVLVFKCRTRGRLRVPETSRTRLQSFPGGVH